MISRVQALAKRVSVTKIAIPVVVAIAGLATYFAVAKVLFSAGASSIASWLAKASPLTLAAAIAIRAATVPLEACVFSLSAASVKHHLRFSSSYRGICASLAMEYVLPFGGLTEVYKVFFYTRCGFTLNEAVAAMFVHRLAMSSSLLAMSIAVCMGIDLEPWIKGLILGTSTALAVTNVAGIAIAQVRKIGSALGKWAESLVDRFVSRLIALPPGYDSVFEFREVSLRMSSVLAAFSIACLEHLAIAFSGYLTVLSLGIEMNFVQALFVFDVIQSVLWLLPAVTPGSIGVLETVQLAALKAISLGPSVAAAPLLYRIVILCSMLPQLMPMLVTDVASFLKEFEKPRVSLGT